MRIVPKTRSLSERFGSGLLIFSDLLIWILAMRLTIWVIHYSQLDFSFIILSPLVVLVALYLVGGYDRRTDFLSLSYFSEHLIAMIAAALCATFFTYLFSSYHEAVKPSRLFLPMIFAVFGIPSIYVRRLLGASWRDHRAANSILVLGAGDEARRFYHDYCESKLNWKLEFVNPAPEPENLFIDGPESPVIADNAEALLAQAEARFTAVLLACEPSQISPSMLHRLIQIHCSDIPVYTVEAFHEQHWRRVNIQAVGPEWLFDCEFRLARGSVFTHLKRLFDLGFSICALLLLSPFLLALCLLIRMESRGPAIFRQERVGRDGRHFIMYKFRTMHENDGDIYTRAGDSRITRLGRLLRMSRLDELPQLWNVMVGQMSLIGPRAEWVKCSEIYEREIPNYHLRHLVTPGITGWAQVNFRYGDSGSDAVEKFQYDLYYIRYFSLRLDVSIILKTIHTMLAGRGR